MQKIFKYPLECENEQIVDLPAGAKILCVGNQNRSVYMWVIADVHETNIQHRKIIVVGIGNNLPYADYERVYLGTITVEVYVFHIFEILDGGNYPKTFKKLEKGTFVEVKD
jgi:hypothetical protein